MSHSSVSRAWLWTGPHYSTAQVPYHNTLVGLRFSHYRRNTYKAHGPKGLCVPAASLLDVLTTASLLLRGHLVSTYGRAYSGSSACPVMLLRWHISRSPSLRSVCMFRTRNWANTATRRVFTATDKNQHLRFATPPPFLRPHARLWTWRTLWLAPIIGGVVVYLSPDPRIHLPSVFSSPTLIPCPGSRDDARRFSDQAMISSPAEPHCSLTCHAIGALRDFIWEPILTARRFIYLFCLFLPVIITIPMLLVGSPDKQLQGDRWGAVWWYGFLVKKMQAAGPTFIKVGD